MSRLIQIQTFLQDSPNDAFLHYALAQEFSKLEHWETALSEYLWLADNHPNYVATYYHLGKLLIGMNRKSEAMNWFDKGISIATEIKELHSLSELQSAKLELEYEDD